MGNVLEFPTAPEQPETPHELSEETVRLRDDLMYFGTDADLEAAEPSSLEQITVWLRTVVEDEREDGSLAAQQGDVERANEHAENYRLAEAAQQRITVYLARIQKETAVEDVRARLSVVAPDKE